MQNSIDLDEAARRARELYESRINVGMALTGPHRETAKNATEAAIKFAENSLKSVTLLNGGGLVAITPVMTLVGATAATDGRTILVIAGGYCLGLLFAVAGHVAGFQAMARRAEGADHFHSGINCFLAIETAASDTERTEWRNRQAAQDKIGRRKVLLYNRWRAFGLFALSAALVAFILASAGGAYWFWNKLGPDSAVAVSSGMPFPPHWLERAGKAEVQ
ncbi:hypothetical protein [Methylorubrum thiocyanatum]|uniref:hypothetical protein n=1 Tax=Methylorubrum thiocyanatum TaxID=47958 RepID=UPI00365B4440